MNKNQVEANKLMRVSENLGGIEMVDAISERGLHGYRFSDKCDKIIPAYIEFQHSLVPVKKTLENKFFDSKYENISDILEMIKEPLYNQKLAVMQIINTLPLITVSNKEMVLKEYKGKYGPYEKLIWTGNWIDVTVREIMIITILFHESQQFIESWYIETPEDNSHHSKGKAITYARKFSIRPILGIAAEDDDGNPIPKENGKTKDKKKEDSLPPPKVENAKKDDFIFDKNGNCRFNKNSNKFHDDEYQKKYGLITTADYLAIQGILKKHKIEFKAFSVWLQFSYEKRFFDISKEELPYIMQVLNNDIEIIKDIPKNNK